MTHAIDGHRHGKLRILVIDDEPDIRETLDAILSSVGYEVATAEDGAAAIAQVQREAFDLAITDLRMPGMSGVDIVAALKRLDPSLAVLVLSGYVSDETAERCCKEGVAGIINKPFHFDDLLRSVHAALDGARA